MLLFQPWLRLNWSCLLCNLKSLAYWSWQAELGEQHTLIWVFLFDRSGTMKIPLGPAESFAWFIFVFAQLISLSTVCFSLWRVGKRKRSNCYLRVSHGYKSYKMYKVLVYFPLLKCKCWGRYQNCYASPWWNVCIKLNSYICCLYSISCDNFSLSLSSWSL